MFLPLFKVDENEGRWPVLNQGPLFFLCVCVCISPIWSTFAGYIHLIVMLIPNSSPPLVREIQFADASLLPAAVK